MNRPFRSIEYFIYVSLCFILSSCSLSTEESLEKKRRSIERSIHQTQIKQDKLVYRLSTLQAEKEDLQVRLIAQGAEIMNYMSNNMKESILYVMENPNFISSIQDYDTNPAWDNMSHKLKIFHEEIGFSKEYKQVATRLNTFEKKIKSRQKELNRLNYKIDQDSTAYKSNDSKLKLHQDELLKLQSVNNQNPT